MGGTRTWAHGEHGVQSWEIDWGDLACHNLGSASTLRR